MRRFQNQSPRPELFYCHVSPSGASYTVGEIVRLEPFEVSSDEFFAQYVKPNGPLTELAEGEESAVRPPGPGKSVLRTG